MQQKMIDTSRLYNIIAETMPTEGRDFTVEVQQTADNKTQLSIKPLTAVGRGFVPALLEKLAEPMKQQGVIVDRGAVNGDEAMTIRKIREEAEREAAASVKARLDAMRKTIADKTSALEEARKARIEKLGDKSAMSKEELDAMRAADTSRQDLVRLEKIVERIPSTRARVDEEAKKAAEEDAKKGQSWAIDMDAPVTTLFDRQDAIQAFRRKEQLVMRLAALAYDTENSNSAAVDATKRFIINKQ